MFSSCRDEEMMNFNFNARVEVPTSDDKVFMHQERFIFWEEGDEITIASNKGLYDVEGNYAHATLVDAGAVPGEDGEDFNFFNGVFITSMPWGSEYFLGVYPKFTEDQLANWCAPNENNSDFGTVKIRMPMAQPVRTTTTASGADISDYTFDKNVFPMVAWYGGGTASWTDSTTAYNLDFHSLAAIVRVQLYNITGNNFTLDSIVFTSRDSKQLSGTFRVVDYKTEDPHLEALSGSTRVAIVKKNHTSLNLPINGSDLRSFYLVLPAYKGRHENTTFSLTMSIYGNSSASSFNKNFTVSTRRNGITYMRAIAIDNISTPTLPPGLAGNGTLDRPFKVYNEEDMRYLRYCYNTTHKINNQPIADFTAPGPYIRIMRSDITLGANWKEETSGIRNFKGTMTYTTSGTNTVQAVTNGTDVPLFHSIGPDGHVEGVAIDCHGSVTLAASDYTPFCITNEGEIKNCRVITSTGTMQIQTPGGAELGVGGLCLTNRSTGTITGCGCLAVFNAAGRNIGGICLRNEGTITGCYVAAPMDVTGAATLGGICHQNTSDGTVKDCYFANALNNKTYNIGGIVYTNNGLIEHCYMGETSSIITTGTVGGIVNTNGTSSSLYGTINYCWVEAQLRGSSTALIACDNYADIVNSFCDNSYTFVTLSTSNNGLYAGGLVAYHYNGTIANCFLHYKRVQRLNNIGNIGGMVGLVTGSTAYIKNCYAYEVDGTQTFYGTTVGTTASTFDRCYLIDGTQADVTTVTAPGDFGNLLTNLNTSRETGWVEWQASAGGYPVLKAYTIQPSPKRRR